MDKALLDKNYGTAWNRSAKRCDMAKFFSSEKRKKRALTALAALLCVSLTAGALAACGQPSDPEDDTPPSATATDTQLLKNGNFEFYGEMDEDELDEKRELINTPDSWSFSPGSPSSDTKSGIVDLADWNYIAKAGRGFTSVDDAAANWTAEGVTAYDRLKFYQDNSIDSKDDFAKYGDYTYSVDYEDVQYLDEEVGGLKLHDHDAQTEKGDTSVLMIHNRRTVDNVRGTAQYYTSGTTVTIPAGAAAKVSVWVKTAALYHYAAGSDPAQDVQVTKRAGAYIGVTNTVGGVTLDQMQIKNINTRNVTENNGWAQYTVYVRANTFATSTFRLVLGLGQGSSDQRYEAVDGYAFFDDVTCDLISADEYAEATSGGTAAVAPQNICTASDRAEDKIFLAVDDSGALTAFNYALDLYAGDGSALGLNGDTVKIGLTEEVSGSRTYTSADIDASRGDNRSDASVEESRRSVAALMSYDDIKNSSNGYLKTIFENDFANYPTSFSKDNIVMLMSTNGAAYTAKLTLPSFSLGKDERLLISFFVKTGVRSGKTGAGAAIVDGKNRSSIASFDSTTVATVDIDDDTKDIYGGWVQCFFFVENDTESDTPKEFRLELTYGPTSIASASANDFIDGYAAFANFEIKTLTRTEYSYAATGSYAAKASLTASVKDETKFDNAAGSGPSVEEGLAIPTSYTGVQAGSNVLVDTVLDADGEVSNPNPGRADLNASGVYAGLLNADYAETYRTGTAAWNTALNTAAGTPADADAFWLNLFGSRNGQTPSPANTAYQPLVILNTSNEAKPSYGFFAKSNATVSASSATRVSVRVKLSQGAKAYVYLTDVSDVAKGFNNRLSPAFPKVTYWYDDEGNIVDKDPAAKDFDAEKNVAYTLESNGLYKKVGGDETLYANLSNFEANDEGNLVTGDGTVAYFFHDGKYYAYYDETKPEGRQYEQVVENLPAEGDIVRYTAPSTLPEAAIAVEGTAQNAGQWVTVSFYIQTGDTEKKYRLELWAGARDNDANGMPANSYVFFDRVKTDTVTNFTDLAEEAEERLRDSNGVGSDEKLPASLAYYYTFTFYDSADYLRYDASQDEKDLGNHWASYQQSAHEEELVWLICDDADGALLGTDAPTYSCFLSYAAVEQTVTPDALDTGDSDTPSTDTDAPTNGGNIWLVLASALLAVVLVAVIVIVIVRRVLAKVKKQRPAKKSKKKAKTKRAPAPAPEETEPEAPAEPATPAPRDEDDPYSE